MKAIRIHPNLKNPHSVAGSAPASALHYDHDVPIPKPSAPGEILIRMRASTVIRDMLTWPEMVARDYQIPGHDFAGVVETVYDGDSATSKLRVGDEVFGMVHADRGGTWAEYCIVKADEAVLKPKSLDFAQAAALPLSALTAYQALFRKAHLALPVANVDAPAIETDSRRRVLITGASGAVGIHLVQLAALAQCEVVAATSSNERNRDFLLSLGATEALEYSRLQDSGKHFDVIIDCVGGKVLDQCWSHIAVHGTLISIDSASWDFVEQRRKTGAMHDSMKAIWFVVQPSAEDLQALAKIFETRGLKSYISGVFPLAEAGQVYESGMRGRGKAVLVMDK